MNNYNQNSTDKYYGMHFFTKNRLDWVEGSSRKKCRLTPKSAVGNDPQFDNKLLVLNHNENQNCISNG